MSRRTIAVCVTGYDWENESRIVAGISKSCRAMDINLLSFSPMTRKLEMNTNVVLSPDVIRGENQIYELIPFDRIDGLLLLGDSFADKDQIPVLKEKADSHGVPVININDCERMLDLNVILSDKTAMQFAVRHLIREHGRHRIGFIGGFPGNIQTEERLAAYKLVLEENDIPFDEELVTYGEFWKKSYDCTTQLMALENKPDAIVCASDSMSFFCMDRLKELGYRVPEDVSVTGFDGIKDGDLYSPKVTSVRLDHEGAGVAAVALLKRIWDGEKPAAPYTEYVDSKLLIKQSCGCNPDKGKNEDFYTDHYSVVNLLKEFNAYTVHSNAVFAGAGSSAELFSAMSRGADFFRLNRMFVCIDAALEKGASEGAKAFDRSITGMSETVLSMVRYGHDIPELAEFRTKELVPVDILNEEKAVFFAFSPLYFKSRTLGYVAFEPSVIEGEGGLFGIWLMNISHNAGSFYMTRELQRIAGELAHLSVRDTLTGLYNRRGMEKLGTELLEKARSEGSTMTIICADIDRLKPINDTYGHEAGDNAITQAAKAILEAMPEHSVCVRTGGDEFCILAAGMSSDETDLSIGRIHKILDEYNDRNGLPYTVGCSCGYASAPACEIGSIDDIMKRADANMYDIKVKKKALRGS